MAAVTLLGTPLFDTNSGTHTVVATPALLDLIVLIVASSGNVANVAPTDTQGGIYDRVNTCVKATSVDTMQAWVRRTPIQFATSTTFSHAPGTSTGGGLAVLKVTGVSRSGLAAIRQSAIQSNQAAAGTPTPALGGVALTTNPIIGAVFNATSPATMTARGTPAYTELSDIGYATPTTGLEVMSIDSGETGSSIAWGSTSASAFCSIALEVDSSTATPVDDGEGWWSGVNRSSVGVAIAGAATALSLAVSIAGGFNKQEEIATPPPPGPSAGAPPTQRVRISPTFVRWDVTDELPTAGAPTVALDDGYQWQLYGYRVPQLQIVGPNWDDQTIQTTVTPLPIDEDYWQPFKASQVAPVVQVWNAPDECPTPLIFTPTEDDPPAASYAPPVANVVVWATDEEIVPQPPPYALDDSTWQPPFSVRATVVAPVFIDSDLYSSFALAEDNWQVPGAIKIAPSVCVFQDDDQIVPQPQAGSVVPDDDNWLRLYSVPVDPIVRLWHQQDEITTAATPIAEEDYWPQLFTVRIDPLVQLWHQQDEIALLAVDEVYGPPLYSVRVDPVVQLWHQQDEITTPTTPIAEEEYWLTLYSVPVDPVVRLWHQQDEVTVQPISFAGPDDDWVIPTAPLVAPKFITWIEDDFVPLFPALDDGYWTLPYSITPLPIVSQWNEPDGFTPKLLLDDGYWHQLPQATSVRAIFVFPFGGIDGDTSSSPTHVNAWSVYRTVDIQAVVRTVDIPAAVRTVDIQAENRSVDINSSDRSETI